jgi:threonine dehydrogenase-like Zn-dependent dehydrogenase
VTTRADATVVAERATMRAVTITGPRRTELVNAAIPAPGPGEVRVAIEGCGVCGSDLPVWEGRPWFDYPRPLGAPGHEAWGRVDALGAGVTGIREGDRVAALGYRSYAEYDVVAAATVVPLPDALDGAPFPGEPLGCAANIVQRAAISAGDTVAVIGTGFLGALIVAFLVAAGARVIAISRRRCSLRAAAALGAGELVHSGPGTVEEVRTLTSERLCDVVIEAAGTQPALDLCGPLTRARGRIVIAGFHQDGPRTVDLQLWNWRGLDVVNAHEREPARYVAGMRRAVDAVASGAVNVAPLLTHRFALGQIDDAFELLATRPDGFVKAVVAP